MSAISYGKIIISLILSIIITIPLVDCDMLREAPFFIKEWTPGPGFKDAGTALPISIVFSGPACLSAAESAFSLTEDGVLVAGSCNWNGPTLVFLPFQPLKPNYEYIVAVSETARDLYGVSLERRFEQRFTTRAESIRPKVTSTVPTDGAVLSELSNTVSITFTEALDAQTFREHLSIVPGIAGRWQLGSSGDTVTFSPIEPWEWSTEYKITVSAAISDQANNRMGEEFIFRFSRGDELVPPTLLSMEAIDGSGNSMEVILPDIAEDLYVTVNRGWESDWRLRLYFDEPVETGTLERYIRCDGGNSFELESDSLFSETVAIRFLEKPEWGSEFVLGIGKGIADECGNICNTEHVVHICADGTSSAPPRLVGIRVPLAPGEILPADRMVSVFPLDAPYSTIEITAGDTRYPIGVPVKTSIELYIDVAEGAILDSFSIMESFRSASTNGAMDFSAQKISLTALAYAPPYEPWAEYMIARVDGTLTNHVDTGIFTVTLAAGLKDSAGNTSIKAQSLALLK